MSSTFNSKPYKGTRDFYPQESVINPDKTVDYTIYQSYIFSIWRKTLINLGFSEYDASIIENADIYIAKSGKELGSDQLYNFLDKGDRKIALRPEMTPTLARMIANKRQNLRFPLRWFSIPNCFRYEQPQKGRLREHWQVNVDILGLKAESGIEIEMLMLVKELYQAFGANQENLKVEINSRKVMDSWLFHYNLSEHQAQIYAIVDNWKKLTNDLRMKALNQFLINEQSQNVFNLCNKNNTEWEVYLDLASKSDDLKTIIKQIKNLGTNFEISPVIIRGQAYYTGVVFEVFDKNISNSRSLFGGGRYDNLMDLYNDNSLPAIGFGSGDVTWYEFLQNWKLLDGHLSFENWKKTNYPIKVGLIPTNIDSLEEIYSKIIPELINQNKAWDIDYDYTRNEKKRIETLYKRGCEEVIKIN